MGQSFLNSAGHVPFAAQKCRRSRSWHRREKCATKAALSPSLVRRPAMDGDSPSSLARRPAMSGDSLSLARRPAMSGDSRRSRVRRPEMSGDSPSLVRKLEMSGDSPSPVRRITQRSRDQEGSLIRR